MRHFDTWILRDPYSIFHYYSTGRVWQESVRGMIQERQICAPQVDLSPDCQPSSKSPIDPVGRSISAQPKCGLLQKLPPEIRLMIYEYVFGDEAVHLVQLKGKIRHVRCQYQSTSIASHRHCCPETPARWRVSSDGRVAHQHSDSMLYPHTHMSLAQNLSNSSLSLLRTCRAIYLEAADIPYSNLSFDVDDLHTFVAFTLSICPRQLRCIKRLTVQWTPIWQPLTGEQSPTSIYSHTHNDHLWKLFWTRVQALTGLESLQLSLDLGRFMGSGNYNIPNTNPNNNMLLGGAANSNNSRKISLEVTEPWITPMLQVRGLKDFELCVTARCDASASNILAEQLGSEAVILRDHLRAVMCVPREHELQQQQPTSELLMSQLLAYGQEFPFSPSYFAVEEEGQAHITKPRLMITAA